MVDWAPLPVDITPSMTLLEMLKSYLGIEDGTQDAELSLALNMAGAHIEAYLDRVIAKREVTEQWPHHWGTVILHNLPVDLGANLTVYLDGVPETGYSGWLDRSGLAHLSKTGERHDMPMDWRPYGQVGVTYTAGFDPIPTDLAQAINYLAADLFKAEGSGTLPGGGGGGSGEVKSMTLYDVGSISYDVGSTESGGSGGTISGSGLISDTVANMVWRYKRLAA